MCGTPAHHTSRGGVFLLSNPTEKWKRVSEPEALPGSVEVENLIESGAEPQTAVVLQSAFELDGCNFWVEFSMAVLR